MTIQAVIFALILGITDTSRGSFSINAFRGLQFAACDSVSCIHLYTYLGDLALYMYSM